MLKTGITNLNGKLFWVIKVIVNQQLVSFFTKIELPDWRGIICAVKNKVILDSSEKEN